MTLRRRRNNMCRKGQRVSFNGVRMALSRRYSSSKHLSSKSIVFFFLGALYGAILARSILGLQRFYMNILLFVRHGDGVQVLNDLEYQMERKICIRLRGELCDERKIWLMNLYE
ncbi:uncharacterized protein LOC141599634 isoform X1 [Silene latifolia]|uniref:uncharacterized protein LOC141599634 isoform X1 n=1 Tax=Silene latifolia TaxID=37657 RepID=UPI003D77CCCB